MPESRDDLLAALIAAEERRLAAWERAREVQMFLANRDLFQEVERIKAAQRPRIDADCGRITSAR